MAKYLPKIVAFLFSIFIIGILLIAGPANAFVLSMTIDDNTVNKGDEIEIEVVNTIESGEFLNINNLSLVLDGPEKVECYFLSNGTIISGCKGITIELIEIPGYGYGYSYGYGYGYNEGDLKFRIIIDTSDYDTGAYTSVIKSYIGGAVYEEHGENIYIGLENEILNGCSIRARDGFFNNSTMESRKNKLNVNIPLRNADNGKGYIIAQDGRTRISYRFEVLSVLYNDKNSASLLVDGDYRKRRDRSEQSAVININKKNEIATINGETFNLTGMDIYFMKRCE